MEHEHQVGNKKDWDISVNDHHLLLTCKQQKNGTGEETDRWTVLSSAVLNGGLQRISCTKTSSIQILNAKVPCDYDGVNPNPVQFMKELAKQAQDENRVGAPLAAMDDERVTMETIGMMTAASMKSLNVATQQAVCGKPCNKQHVIVDAIVTAGISNSRAAGADADCFFFSSPDEGGQQTTTQTSGVVNPGTINTIVVTNAILDDPSSSANEAALVEAYMIAIEAKCRAAADLGVICAKHPGRLAQGTGTDCTMFVCRRNGAISHETLVPRVQYAGKHMLFGELVGRAVYEATQKAMLTNIEHMYGSRLLPAPLIYRWHRFKLQLFQAIAQGHRPQVPSHPMNPVPKPQGVTLLVGCIGVTTAFCAHLAFAGDTDQDVFTENATTTSLHFYIRPSVSVLFGVLSWDRFLGGSLFVPISLHPVVLVGRFITNFLSVMPESVFQHRNRLLGMAAGFVLLSGTVLVSVVTAWCLMLLSQTHVPLNTPHVLSKFLPWFLELYLVQSALSLQLLCTIALQMANFLERGQMDEAREQLSWLCSRDPTHLVAVELAGGTLESLAENLSDSLVTPLTWYMLLGPLGAFGFRVINTLDSRVGIRGGRYEYVGKLSARTDDVLNLFSARLTALLLALAAWLWTILCGRRSPQRISAFRGLQAAFRDAGQCDSPNAGWPMGAMAGILNVCLEKKGQYALHKTGRPPCHQAIRTGYHVAQLAGILAILLTLLVSFIAGSKDSGVGYRW